MVVGAVLCLGALLRMWSDDKSVSGDET